MKRNLTLAIDEKLLEQARIVAVKQRTSLTQMVRNFLESTVKNDTAFQAAREHLLGLIATPPLIVGAKRWTRDELHERQ